MQQTRRSVIKAGGALGLVAAFGAVLLQPGRALAARNQGAFEAKSTVDAMRALGLGNAEDSKDILIRAPDIAENGAVVPVACAATLPGVKQLLLLVEKNPNALAAVFDVNDAIEANFATRVKMGQSSSVYAVAMMADGKVLFAQKEIKVTLGGCGG